MKKLPPFYLFVFTMLLILACQPSRSNQNRFANIVPSPNEIIIKGEVFNLPDKIVVLESKASENELGHLSKILLHYTNNIKMTNEPVAAHFVLNLDNKKVDELGREGYKLEITEQQIQIKAANSTGLFYGIQTLKQLLFLADTKSGRPVLAIQTITDQPRFQWRGSMLDVARRFMSPKYIKKHIDRMAAYKLNRLHLHLTDDQGWRIEVKGWPELTEVGGKGACGDGQSGFLSQEEYLDLQQYARDRHVTIIPEIDLPGHIYAALVSYPDILLCKDTSNINPMHVSPPQLYRGDQVGWSKLCLSDGESYRFVNEVLKELSTITIGEYIHIGGDEIEDERYADFVTWADSVVRANGKIMIGWEEVAKAKIHASSIVQQWHGKIPVDKKQPTIFSLCKHLYLDHANFPGQEKTNNWCKKDGVDIKDVYGLQIDPNQRTLGIEAPIWTEYINEGAQADDLLWPRLLAVSERGWSQQKQNYEDFMERVKEQLPMLEEMEVAYYKHPDLK